MMSNKPGKDYLRKLVEQTVEEVLTDRRIIEALYVLIQPLIASTDAEREATLADLAMRPENQDHRPFAPDNSEYFARIRCSNGFSERVGSVSDVPDVLKPAQYYRVIKITKAQYDEFNETGRVPELEHCMWDDESGGFLSRKESDAIMDAFDPDDTCSNDECCNCSRCLPNGTDCGGH